MIGDRKLRPAVDAGIAAVRKADASLRLLIGLAALTAVLAACTLAAVLGMRAGRPA
jgi:hypothetical protein